MIAEPRSTPAASGRAQVESPPGRLRAHRSGPAIWITTPEWEAAGRALGLPDPAAVARLLDPPPAQVAGSAGRAKTRVEPLAGSDQRLHVRRALHGGWLAPLWRGRIAGLARLRDELELTARLHAAGAPVPAPAFAVALRSGMLWRAALCTVHLDDTIDGIRLLGTNEVPLGAAAAAAGGAVRELHERGVRHADLHVGNLLVRPGADGSCTAWVIDLDRAQLGAPLAARLRSRELRRLLRSLRKRTDDPARVDEAIASFESGYRAAATSIHAPRVD